jgi:hypothetical protein
MYESAKIMKSFTKIGNPEEKSSVQETTAASARPA